MTLPPAPGQLTITMTRRNHRRQKKGRVPVSRSALPIPLRKHESSSPDLECQIPSLNLPSCYNFQLPQAERLIWELHSHHFSIPWPLKEACTALYSLSVLYIVFETLNRERPHFGGNKLPSVTLCRKVS